MVPDILEHDHQQLSALMRGLKSDLHQHDAGQRFESLDRFWARLALHIRAENLCLFPAILNAPRELFGNRGVPPFEEAEIAVESLRADHNFFMDELSRAVKTLREILAEDGESQDVSDQLDTIRKRVDGVSLRLETHNALEEEQVYKWPSLILGPSDLERLGAALKRELQNLPQRFAAQSSAGLDRKRACEDFRSGASFSSMHSGQRNRHCRIDDGTVIARAPRSALVSAYRKIPNQSGSNCPLE